MKHTLQISEDERQLLLSLLPYEHPLARSLRFAPEVAAFEEAWGPRWTGSESASSLYKAAAALRDRVRRDFPHLTPTPDRLVQDASRAARNGL